MNLPKSLKFSLASCMLIFLVLPGCASRPIVDTAGLDMQQYQADMADCEQVAQQVDVGSSMVASAGLGALIGAAFGLIAGDSTAVAYGAGWGAVSGAADGGLGADQERSAVWKNCLYNRGYAVLN